MVEGYIFILSEKTQSDKKNVIIIVWYNVYGRGFRVTFNNISVISWQSVLLVEETRSTQRKPPTCRKSL